MESRKINSFSNLFYHPNKETTPLAPHQKEATVLINKIVEDIHAIQQAVHEARNLLKYEPNLSDENKQELKEIIQRGSEDLTLYEPQLKNLQEMLASSIRDLK